MKNKTLSSFIFFCCIFLACSNNSNQMPIEQDNAPVLTSTITCPKCGHKKLENLPTDVCRIKYNCENCNVELVPKDGDCCVFCTYGDHKCPSMQ